MYIGKNEDIPPQDAQDQEVPEKIQTLQEQNRCKYLPSHPPHHPDALRGRETTRRLSTALQSATQEHK